MVMLQGYLVGIDSCFSSPCFNIPLMVFGFCKKKQNTIIFSKMVTMDLERAPFRITQLFITRRAILRIQCRKTKSVSAMN